MSTQSYWDSSYRSKTAEQRSWSSDATTSLRIIEQHQPRRSSAIIDVGGGASPLGKRLVDAGYGDVTVMDISQTAIDEIAADAADSTRIKWVRADVRTWEPGRKFDVWHDRAVLHFLNDSAERVAYAELVGHTLNSGGLLIVASFAEDGPEICSGLPVTRATHEELTELFDGAFSPVEAFREVHHTPWGSEQPFNWLVLRRVAD